MSLGIRGVTGQLQRVPEPLCRDPQPVLRVDAFRIGLSTASRSRASRLEIRAMAGSQVSTGR